MKYGNHQNYCNGPGDCSCGEDYQEHARSTIRQRNEDVRRENEQWVDPILLRKKAAEFIKRAEQLESANP